MTKIAWSVSFLLLCGMHYSSNPMEKSKKKKRRDELGSFKKDTEGWTTLDKKQQKEIFKTSGTKFTTKKVSFEKPKKSHCKDDDDGRYQRLEKIQQESRDLAIFSTLTSIAHDNPADLMINFMQILQSKTPSTATTQSLVEEKFLLQRFLATTALVLAQQEENKINEERAQQHKKRIEEEEAQYYQAFYQNYFNLYNKQAELTWNKAKEITDDSSQKLIFFNAVHVLLYEGRALVRDGKTGQVNYNVLRNLQLDSAVTPFIYSQKNYKCFKKTFNEMVTLVANANTLLKEADEIKRAFEDLRSVSHSNPSREKVFRGLLKAKKKKIVKKAQRSKIKDIIEQKQNKLKCSQDVTINRVFQESIDEVQRFLGRVKSEKLEHGEIEEAIRRFQRSVLQERYLDTLRQAEALYTESVAKCLAAFDYNPDTRVLLYAEDFLRKIRAIRSKQLECYPELEMSNDQISTLKSSILQAKSRIKSSVREVKSY